MLRVLLVDDEPFIVQGLKVLIDWESQGFEIAATAANGAEALAYLTNHTVELIIADIRMPVMSGISLLQKIREEQISEAHFVILSGYNDFQYAKQAITYSCMDYILKPIQRDELLGILRKCASLQESSQQKKDALHRQERALLEHHLFSVLTGKHDEQILAYVQEQLKPTPPLRYVVLRPEQVSPEQPSPEQTPPEQALPKQSAPVQGTSDAFSNGQKRALQKKTCQACAEFLGDIYGRHCFFDISDDEDGYNVGMLFCGGMARGLSEREFIQQLFQHIREKLNWPLSVFLGKPVESLAELSGSYRSIAVLKSLHMFQKGDRVCYYEEEQPRDISGKVLCKETLDTLIAEIERNHEAGICASVELLYAEMAKIGMEAETISLNINYLLFQLIQLAVEHDNGINQKEIVRRIGNNRLTRGSISKNKEYLKVFFCEYAEYLMQLRKDAAGGILKDIEREVRQNYAENLTLKELSKKYFINSAYLGQLFRKKYEISFKDYLNNCRIEQAAVLLVRTDKRVYEIAKEVGYHNLDYFINRFISSKGCTPVKYRKQAAANAE